MVTSGSESTRTWVFWYHFNKPAWRSSGTIKWTVHFRGKCHIVDDIVCEVETFSHTRNSQPVAVIKGKCSDVVIDVVASKRIARIKK